MADSMETKFKFEVKQNDQSVDKKSTKLFGPSDSNVFRKALQDATKANVAVAGQQPAIDDMEQLHAIYISNAPGKILDKDLLNEHFSQFGKVKRVYISNVRKSAIVHFENHEMAKLAKTSGALLQGHKLDVFWSKSAKVNSQGGKKSPQSPPPSEKQFKLHGREAAKAKTKATAEGQSTQRAYTLSEEVEDELRAMSGGDITKYQERPRSAQASAATQVLQKQKALALNRMVRVRRPSQGSPGKRGPGHADAAAAAPQPVAKHKARASPKHRAKAADHVSAADTLFALTKRQAVTAEDRYQILESRDKILRKLQSRSLTKRSSLVGTCPDMCPEKERYHRELTNQVAFYERLSTDDVRMDHSRAVKQYSRSSADQDDTLCHELRPAPVLVRTMDYLRSHVMDLYGPHCNLQDWFQYLWDRTRSIRKDITQQELCDRQCVSLVEQCARFHIHCAEQLVAEDPAIFDQKINTENLTKCLQTLKYMYMDMALKGEHCPREAEFRAYMVLLNLNDSNFIWDLKQVRHEILHSAEVQFSLRVHAAIHGRNYVRFFKLVRRATYLAACLLQRYFYQVRTSALLTLCKACCPGRAAILFPVAKLMELLAFESESETHEFLACCGLAKYDSEGRKLVVLSKGAVSVPQVPPQCYRAPGLIESKMEGTLAEVVYGGVQPSGCSDISPVGSSFDEQGFLKVQALFMGDEGDTGLFRVPASEPAPKRKKSSPVALKTFKLGGVGDAEPAPEGSDTVVPATPSRPALGVVKPLGHGPAAPTGSSEPTATLAKPAFSFRLDKPREEAVAPPPLASPGVHSFATDAGTVPGDISAEVKPTPKAFAPETRPHIFTKAHDVRRGSAAAAKQVAVPAVRPVSPPDSPLRGSKPAAPASSSKLPSPFGIFDRSKSAASGAVPFLWKPKPIQEVDGRSSSKDLALKPDNGFSTSPSFFNKDQNADRERLEKESEERAEAARKQRGVEEEKKRVQAEEQKRRLEEERQRIAAQKEILMSRESQKVLELLLKEITHDTCSAILKEAQLAECTRRLLDEVLDSVLAENIRALLDGAVRDRRLVLFTEKVKHRRTLQAWEKWRLFAARHRKRREAAENFPPLALLWSSPDHLCSPSAEQVALLHLPDCSKYFKRVWLPKLDVCSVVGRRLLARMRELGCNSPDLFWKLVVSLPSSEESLYNHEATAWAGQVFTAQQQLRPPPGSNVVRVESTDVVFSDISLSSAVVCASGIPGAEAARGASALVLWVPSSGDDWGAARRRLRGLAGASGARRPAVPAVALLVRNMAGLRAGEVARRLGLDDLVREGRVSRYSVEMPSGYSSEAIHLSVVKALQWLSERSPDPAPLVVHPLHHVLDEMVHRALRQIATTVQDTVFASRAVQSPNNLIYLYNKVLCALGDCLLDPELAEYGEGPPEFRDHAPETFPPGCGTPRYYTTIQQVLKKAQLLPIQPWPPVSVHELVLSLEQYCRSSRLLDHWPLYSYLECAVQEHFKRGGSPDDSSQWLEFLQSVDWTKVVEIIVSKKLESLQMLSSDEEQLKVAISKKNLSAFLDTFWWFTSEELEKVVETPFTESASSKRKVAESAAQQAGKKLRVAGNPNVADNSATEKPYKQVTREIDATIAALKSVNEEIMKMLEHEQEALANM